MVMERYVTVCAENEERIGQLAGLGRSIADAGGRRLRIAMFADRRRSCRENARMLETVFACAKRVDAEMNVYYTGRPAERLTADGLECIVVGEEGMVGELRERFPDRRLVLME